MSYADYFGDEVIGKNAKSRIISAFRSVPGAFQIKKADDLLIYTVPENSAYEIGYLVDELPSKLNARKIGTALQLKYSEAKKFFGIDFRKRLLRR